MRRLLITVIALAAATAAQAGILWDIHSNGDNSQNNDATLADFTDAGVTENISGETVEIVMADVLMDSMGVTLTAEIGVNSYGSPNPPNALLQDYIYMRDVPVNNMMISGLAAVLAPKTEYSFYLWGVGDNPPQNAVFTFNGVTKATSEEGGSSSPAAVHGVKFNFTTDPVVGDTLDFVWEKGPARWSAINGLAIVPVPEPGTMALFGVFGLALIARRRFLR